MEQKEKTYTTDLSKADAKSLETLTKLEKTPSVELIISSQDGKILGTFNCGVNPQLAKLLSVTSQADDPQNPVEPQKDTLLPLGQDFYTVTKDYVLSVRGTFFPTRTLQDIDLLAKTMPDTACYTFVVSY